MIRALIIDDEELALLSLQKKLQNFDEIECVCSFTDPHQALVELNQIEVDVAFVDIEMVDVNGLDIASKMLDINPKLHIVFVTAHAEYAVQAFELNSIDYLLKPVLMKRLEKTIARIIPYPNQKQEAPNKGPIPLRVQVFHDFQVAQGDHNLSFKTAKVKELFAYFVMHQLTPIHRDVLIEALWADQDYKKAKIHLHTCLSHLRKTLDSRGYINAISFVDGCYTFSIDAIERDCDQVEQAYLLDSPLDKAGVKQLEQAIHAYTGNLMEQNGYKWTYQDAEVYQQKVLLLLNRLIDYYQLIDLDRTYHFLQVQRKIQPYSVNHVQQLMLLSAKKGQRSEALRIYEEYAQLLSEDFGMAPDQKLKALYQRFSANE
ncbi:response regulator [Paenibacillus sp. 1001270B_150601_E10]|uniref:response regulator n=1 Tax=Paenibacillus sp. 1001270B_150601_E10 TaxID=2787079 RepID=UPI00189CB998|nr:response regulator [Paenibacillus sp. 1001270B_150601_E10]